MKIVGPQEPILPIQELYPAIGPCQSLQPLGSGGGFSGARLWRFTGQNGAYCLRRWPYGAVNSEKLSFIHGILRTAFRKGVREVPCPLPRMDGSTWVQLYDHFWEITPWMPGVADYRFDPRPEKLKAALAWLARFHRVTQPTRPTRGRANSIAERAKLLHKLACGEAETITRQITQINWADFVSLAQRVLLAFQRDAPAVARLLSEAADIPVPLQPCIRDIWHDHVLFDGDAVSGVVDFGALRSDECVAADIARLVGSLVADVEEGWRVGLDAYSAVRPLDANERRLVMVFDTSSVLLSGMNWLRWICLEKRLFDNRQAVVRRLEGIVSRLERPRRIVLE